MPKHLNIILVDDDSMIRSSICQTLRAAQMNVAEASSADEALDVLEKHSTFDMMVTDVEMQGSMNGIDLAHIVSKRWPGMALLITSGCDNLDLNSLPSGAAFLAKPATALQLMRSIAAISPRRMSL